MKSTGNILHCVLIHGLPWVEICCLCYFLFLLPVLLIVFQTYLFLFPIIILFILSFQYLTTYNKPVANKDNYWQLVYDAHDYFFISYYAMLNSIENNKKDDSIHVYNCDEDDGKKLIKPRNNFASYSNEDIDVRFYGKFFSCYTFTHPSIGFLRFLDEMILKWF